MTFSVQAAIFDMDGTLLDSMGFWRTLTSRYLASMGLRLDPVTDRQLYTMTLEEGAALLRERYGIEKSPGQIVRETMAIADDFYRNEAPLKPGADTLIRGLKRAGVPVCVASLSPLNNVRSGFARHGLLEEFAFVLSCYGTDMNKETPQVYLSACERLDASPARTLVFEDSPVAAKTAAAAGFPVIGIRDDCFRETEDVLRQACVAVLDTPGDFLDTPLFRTLAEKGNTT